MVGERCTEGLLKTAVDVDVHFLFKSRRGGSTGTFRAGTKIVIRTLIRWIKVCVVADKEISKGGREFQRHGNLLK